jgi:hypothetical protein
MMGLMRFLRMEDGGIENVDEEVRVSITVV